MRSTWTDARLDDGFDRVSAEIALVRNEVNGLRADMKAEFKSVRAEMKAEFKAVRREIKEQIGELRGEMKDEIGELRGEISALNRTFVRMGGGIIATILGVLVTQL